MVFELNRSHYCSATEKKMKSNFQNDQMMILEMKLIIPQSFVIQLHLFNSLGLVICGLGCCWAALATLGSLLLYGEIKCSADEIFSSSRVKESVREESFEFCDNVDNDEDEELLWSRIGWTLLWCLGKNLWFNFCDSLALVLFSMACLLTFASDIVGKKRKSALL